MKQIQNKIQLNELKSNILKTLIYFDVFSYPITIEELLDFMHFQRAELPVLESALQELCNEKIVYKLTTFYSLKRDEARVEKRLKGNSHAQKFIEIAYKKAKFIGAFPYVRGVCISGSLSKGYMDESGDIDYFIITQPERLWIARTILVLYKKIFLLNSRKHFCVNYFIDTNNLQIPDKNIFTATEVLTLIPAYNTELFDKFIKHNDWAYRYLPNKKNTNNVDVNYQKNNFKLYFEKMLDGKWGEKLDDFLMKFTLNKWRKKFKHLQEENFELALRTRKYVSKHHPQSFQLKVLSAIDKKINELEEQHQMKLV